MNAHKRLAARRAPALAVIALFALVVGCSSPDASSSTASSAAEETEDATDAANEDAADAAPEDAGEQYHLKFATYQVPGGALARANEEWAELLTERTNGRVTVEFFWQGSLLGPTEIMPGVQDGRAELGYVVPQFHPAEMPLSQAVNTLFVTSNTEAQIRALQDLYDNDENFQEEFRTNGLHLLMAGPVGSNLIMSTFPVASLDDLARRQVRAVGFVQPALDAIGANTVAISQGEVYESLQRGVIEATSGADVTIAIDFNYQEVADYFVDPGFGQYAWVANVISLDLWESMPEDIRQAITEVSADYADIAMRHLTEVEDEACQTALDAGVEVSALDEGEASEWENAVRDSLIDLWRDQASDVGAPADEFWSAYTTTLERYEAEYADYEPGLRRCIAAAG